MNIYRDAACLGADPHLFDAVSGSTALHALSYCERCPVVPLCDDLVKPRRSHYDGVAAARVWRDGRVIKREALLD